MTIEEIICNFLTERLTNCIAKPERGERPYGRMVFVERTGGNGRFIRNTTVAIQSYETSMYKAAKLNDDVVSAMNNIVELPQICRCDLNSNYNFTDTETKEYRYQAVFDIKHYE